MSYIVFPNAVAKSEDISSIEIIQDDNNYILSINFCNDNVLEVGTFPSKEEAHNYLKNAVCGH